MSGLTAEHRRWCVGCLEDYAENDSEIGYCLACKLEHQRAVDLGRIRFKKGNNTPTDWGIWPTLSDLIDSDKLYDDGFHNFRGDLNARGQSLREDGLLTRDPWRGGVWRGCHSCGDLFQETEWPASPRCRSCEDGINLVEV